MKHTRHHTALRNYLTALQLAGCTPAATEAIAHALRERVYLLAAHPTHHLAIRIDTSNAFKAIERNSSSQAVVHHLSGAAQWFYSLYIYPNFLNLTGSTYKLKGQAAKEPLRDVVLLACSSSPLPPAATLVLCRPPNVWYANDGNLIAPASHVPAILDLIRHKGAKIGFHVNVARARHQRVGLQPMTTH
eukprot:GFKZ01001277.1.p1 GENE.GFKZ01001277.1~~GFKZ01001277.1.p1  ORF type:complete len:189 (-),score=13.42 GFKZ01001277.1:1329-1895(-)